MHRARRVDANELQVLADVRAALVERRRFAEPQWPHGDAIADSKTVDALADFRDLGGCFVADDLRRSDATVHRPVVDVDVGAADAAISHSQTHLSGAWRNRLANPGGERPLTPVNR